MKVECTVTSGGISSSSFSKTERRETSLPMDSGFRYATTTEEDESGGEVPASMEDGTHGTAGYQLRQNHRMVVWVMTGTSTARYGTASGTRSWESRSEPG